jgi:GT2 family glycosyltransferase
LAVLSIVIVSWNVRSLLERCLLSLHANDSSRDWCEIIVVDSASSDGTVEMLRQQFPSVRLVASQSNLGFSKGNNVGIAQSSGQYILLLNPDTEIVGDALSALVAYMDSHSDVGVVGPRVLFPDGRIQSSRRRFPTLATAFIESTVLQPWFSHSRVLRNYYVLDRSDDQEQDVDWLIGACLFIRRKAWEQVGPLDEALFMYSEELDWCRRANASGWRVVYIPWATITHHEGQSSSQVVPARQIYFQSSKVHYYRKHHGLLASEALRIFLLGTYVYQLFLESAKWLLGHKRLLRRERVTAYWRVLHSGLRTPGAALPSPEPTRGATSSLHDRNGAAK